MTDRIERLARLIQQSRALVAFTGAGASTESGIPDFRSPGGIWTKYTPVMFQDFLASHEARARYWKMHAQMRPAFSNVKPNPTHTVLAELEKQGRLLGLITQNVDRLHHAAGSSEAKVIELHGRNDITKCLSCGLVYDSAEIARLVEKGLDVPVCDDCGGWLKPATISFGQNLIEEDLERAAQWARQADLFLAIGSSLTVHPAASLPWLALQAGAKLVIINAAETPYDLHAHLVINEKSGQVLSAAWEKISKTI